MTKDELEDLTEACENDSTVQVSSKALLSLIAAARELEELRWVPVTERLPPESEGVLVSYGASGMVTMAWHRGPAPSSRRRKGDWDSWPGVMTNITHWMPLPKGPTSAR